jgi:hypothetical protein
MMPSMKGYEKFASALLIISVIISFTVFLFYLFSMVIFPSTYVRDGVSSFPLPLIPNTYLSILLISAIIAVISIYIAGNFIRNFYGKSSSTQNFYGNFSIYFVLFLAAGILIGEVEGLLYPSTSVLTMSVMAYNFYGQILISTYTIVLQILPIIAIMFAYGRQNKISFLDLLAGKRTIPNGLIFRIILVLLVYDSLILYLLQGFDSLPFIVSTFIISNVIFVKFGLPRAFLSNFMYIAVSVAGFAISSSTGLTIGYEIYLLIVIFGGVFMGGALLNRHIMGRFAMRREETDVSHRRDNEVKGDNVKLWVNGACPNCNNVNFSLSKDMVLTCTKCGREITPDEVLPNNILVMRGRVYVAGKSTNDDLYR